MEPTKASKRAPVTIGVSGDTHFRDGFPEALEL